MADRGDLGDPALTSAQLRVVDHEAGRCSSSAPPGRVAARRSARRIAARGGGRHRAPSARSSSPARRPRRAGLRERGRDAARGALRGALDRHLRRRSPSACCASYALEAGLDPFFETVGAADRLAMLLERIDELPLRRHEIRGNPAGLLARLLRADRRAQGARGSTPRRSRRGPRGASARPRARPAEREAARRELEFAELYARHDAILRDAGSLDAGDLVLELGAPGRASAPTSASGSRRASARSSPTSTRTPGRLSATCSTRWRRARQPRRRLRRARRRSAASAARERRRRFAERHPELPSRRARAVASGAGPTSAGRPRRSPARPGMAPAGDERPSRAGCRFWRCARASARRPRPRRARSSTCSPPDELRPGGDLRRRRLGAARGASRRRGARGAQRPLQARGRRGLLPARPRSATRSPGCGCWPIPTTRPRPSAR